MIVWLAVTLLAGAGPEFSMPVLLPEDLVDAQGIRLEAQTPEPEPGMVLFEKNPDRPSLWYAPVASRTQDDGTVQFWYQRVEKSAEDYSDQRTLCLGEIRDGKWTLPKLHPDPPAWGGPNNVCMRRSPYKPTWGGFNVFQIVEAEGALQMLYWDQPSRIGPEPAPCGPFPKTAGNGKSCPAPCSQNTTTHSV